VEHANVVGGVDIDRAAGTLDGGDVSSRAALHRTC